MRPTSEWSDEIRGTCEEQLGRPWTVHASTASWNSCSSRPKPPVDTGTTTIWWQVEHQCFEEYRRASARNSIFGAIR